MLKRWFRAGPLDSLQMGLVTRRTKWLKRENFPLGVGEETLKVEVYKNPWTAREREHFGVGEHVHMLGGWCTPISQTEVLLLGTLPDLCVLLYYQLVSVSKVTSWVWWADLANYQTQGGGPGSPLFIASRSEVWVAWDLQLASEVEVILWDWALSCRVCANSG